MFQMKCTHYSGQWRSILVSFYRGVGGYTLIQQQRFKSPEIRSFIHSLVFSP